MDDEAKVPQEEVRRRRRVVVVLQLGAAGGHQVVAVVIMVEECCPTTRAVWPFAPLRAPHFSNDWADDNILPSSYDTGTRGEERGSQRQTEEILAGGFRILSVLYLGWHRHGRVRVVLMSDLRRIHNRQHYAKLCASFEDNK